MKRTIHLSTDAKVSSNSIKLNPISQKKSIQPLPLTSSTSQPITLSVIEDTLATPKLNRGIKSQTQFNYPLTKSNFKIKTKEVNTSRSPPLPTERPQVETEVKKKIIESITKELSRQKIEAKSLKKLFNETTTNISNLEKKLFRIQFQEKSLNQIPEEYNNGIQGILDNIENNDVEIDDIESAKKLIFDQTKAYEKLEETYCFDTNALKREIEKLKLLIKKQETDLLILRSKIELNSNEREEMEKKLVNEQRDRNKEKKDLEDQISEKSSEIAQLGDILNKIKQDRKSKDESLKDFQRQVLVLTGCNNILDSNLNTTKRLLTAAQESLEVEKDKNKFYDSQTEELSELRSAKQVIEERLKETLKSLDFVTSNYNILQNKYNNSKEDLEEKTNQLQETLQKLSEVSPNTKISTKPGLRRTVTLNAASLMTDSSQKETFNRLYLKITSLEEEIQNEKIEKEKLNRNFDYLKRIVDEKLQIIAKLESQVKSDYMMQVDIVKKCLAKDVRELLNSCEKHVHIMQEVLTCVKCKVSTETKFISWDCEHVLCKGCAMFRETCPECHSGSRVLKLKLLKKISLNFQSQLDSLLKIRELFRTKSEN